MNKITAEQDRELLELAAKAAGYGDVEYCMEQGGIDRGWIEIWNPLADDRDALRLAVKLGIKVTPYPIYVWPKHSVLADRLELTPEGTKGPQVIEIYKDDSMAATRRAIVRAAAEIGKEMK